MCRRVWWRGNLLRFDALGDLAWRQPWLCTIHGSHVPLLPILHLADERLDPITGDRLNTTRA